jgi:hypothetical protein
MLIESNSLLSSQADFLITSDNAADFITRHAVYPARGGNDSL